MHSPLTPKQIYDHLSDVITSDRFLRRQGLGNEVPFFICPFPPSTAVEMEDLRRKLVNKLRDAGTEVLDINLYDLAIQMLQERDIWERVLGSEVSLPKAELKNLLRNVLDPETRLVPAIANLIAERGAYHVMFLSGVGEVFPYIRSHTVLNNLQSTAKQQPTVLFFPGSYTHSATTGASLDLFGRLGEDKYYRAFNILHYNV